jgi:hypothetical protein
MVTLEPILTVDIFSELIFLVPLLIELSRATNPPKDKLQEDKENEPKIIRMYETKTFIR